MCVLSVSNNVVSVVDNSDKSTAPAAFKPSKKDMAFELLDRDSDISNKALAEQVGIGESTARSYRAQWRKGKAVPSGHGG